MNESKLDLYEINYQEGLDRFMNKKSAYDSFLLRFQDEDIYKDVVKYYAAKDYGEMQTAVHALKGLAGNLSLTHMFRICSEMMVYFRSNNYKPIDGLYDELVKTFKKVTEMINLAKE